MRIWDLDPASLCDQHLLGEHRELHGIWSILTTGKRGYSHHPETLRWRGRLAALYARHEDEVAEMGRRGFRHASPLDVRLATGEAQQTELVDSVEDQRARLAKRAWEYPSLSGVFGADPHAPVWTPNSPGRDDIMFETSSKRGKTAIRAWNGGRSVLSRGVSHLRRNTVAYLALIDRAQPAVRVEDDTQVELTSATAVLMDLDDEIFDTGEMHPGNGNDDRIRVPRTGTYVLSGEVEWAPNGSGYRTLDLVQLNAGVAALGSSLVEPRDSAIQPTIQQVTAIVRLAEGATIGLRAGQASGVDLEVVRGTLSAAFVSP